MNYREALEMSKNCPKCCKKALERFMNQKQTAETTKNMKTKKP